MQDHTQTDRRGASIRWRRARAVGERGASLVEYALLVALIAIVCFLAIIFVGESTSSHFESTGSSLGEL